MNVVLLEQIQALAITATVDFSKSLIEFELSGEKTTDSIWWFERDSEGWGCATLGGQEFGYEFSSEEEDESKMHLVLCSMIDNKDGTTSYDASHMKEIEFKEIGSYKKKRLILLCDGNGEWDDIVTPELAQLYDLEYRKDTFSPLTEREESFMFYGKGMSLANEGWSRLPRMYLKNGVKCINISDDDTYFKEEDADRLEGFNKNFKNAKAIFSEIAQAFGVELSFDDKTKHEYWADIYIPVSVFDFIKTAKELQEYFVERKYLTCSYAEKYKALNV